MSLVTFRGDENLLEVISEEQIELLNLSEREIASSITSIMHYQEWTKYFTMLDKPVYLNLVKDFWKHAHVDCAGCSISSRVFGIPITTTPFTIAIAIGCENIGVTVEYVKSWYIISEQLISLHNTSTSYEPINPENLLPIPKAWFKLLLTNFRPREENKDILFYDDWVFIFLLMDQMRINLPRTIFNFLQKSIIVSRNQTKSYIPFGRVLSEIFFKEGIVEFVRRNGPENGLLKKNCEVFNG